jgi:shikimate kinase
MNIVLIGMRGSGKTTVGKILAQKLGRELVEMDELIAQRAGLTIPEMVERHGWERFRDIEEEITGEVTGRNNMVNAAGGGVVTREQNIARLKENGVLVWLKANLDTLVERVAEDNQRPPLVEGRSRWGDMEMTLEERKPLYQRAADLVVNTENKTPEEVADLVINLLTIRGFIK